MSSDEDDVILLWWWARQKKISKKRRYWVHPINVSNICSSTSVVANELHSDPDKFKTFYRMSKSNFDNLVHIVGPKIFKKDTNFRIAVPVEERILITLRFLATGCNFRALAQHFMRGETTVGKIIAETTEAIWECLQPTYLPVPSLELWKNIAARYNLLWQLPHCLGSINGKHIRIKKFNNTGSRNFNYKGFFSIQLLACADADGCFITVDIGDLGRNSDGGVIDYLVWVDG
ncbi:uncharacterized protein LOC115033804 [Acyrthosiphon pisum]|uniref:DUF8040 domain-containing protein n=1 Tax=Acyrthosiphon pisum TaxID=7029 RepID=A0A8R2NQ19_ACYPI|nr:uncharacterized protein LOC115033804 [Acyrthosiphon pisum]